MRKCGAGSSRSCSTSPRSCSTTTSSSRSTTNLHLGLSIHQHVVGYCHQEEEEEEEEDNNNSSLFVKVYMEGHPIGRKLNILAHRSYHQLISTLDHMFNANILWGEEVDAENCHHFHVLTYEDEEGDWLMVGDVPWEMFLSAVKRLKISRAMN